MPESKSSVNTPQNEVNQLTAVDNLVYGYKLGVLMTAEAFMTSDGLFEGEDNV
ncbi:MAG: hypothetical protein FWC55_08490 [Firmicutes bacterium]|nr:hypothetical protein [Bacillota bacterium]